MLPNTSLSPKGLGGEKGEAEDREQGGDHPGGFWLGPREPRLSSNRALGTWGSSMSMVLEAEARR